eukprot:TRINITY_DN4002_c0_g3_i1.p1 TRINITY_DN4002_c0_g3~~TRINITY_DN4002_c0_g3_i1.p1  ORF type:complete len:905 (+),score=206.33 TRINITY_DN4002_c0_g3_i1:83-2797(+)
MNGSPSRTSASPSSSVRKLPPGGTSDDGSNGEGPLERSSGTGTIPAWPTPVNPLEPRSPGVVASRHRGTGTTAEELPPRNMTDALSSDGGIAAIRQQLAISDAELEFCRQVFHSYDADGSGTIDLQELGEVMRGLGVNMNDVQLRELLDQVDVNGSNEVDFGEFLQLISLYKEASQYMFFDVGPGHVETAAQQHVRMSLDTKDGTLIPDARWRWFWNLGLMMVTMWFALWTPHRNIHDWKDPPWMLVLHALFSCYLGVDIWLCSHTGYVPDGEQMVESIKPCLRHYARTWAVPDVLSTVPFELMPSPVSTTLSWMRLLRLVKVPFLWDFSDRTQVDEMYIRFHFAVMPIVTVVWWFVIVVHFATEIVIKLQQARDDPQLEDFTYAEGVYLVLYTLSTVGYGDIDTRTNQLRLFCCVLVMISMVVNGLIIGQITNSLAKADIRAERKDKMRQTLAVMKYFEIPGQLQNEILQFQYHILEHNLSASYTELLQGLPQPMQDHLGLYVRMKFISMVPMFREAHHGCKIALAQALATVVCCPEQYIIVVHEEGREMYFMGHGFADVVAPDGKFIATIKKGGFFGEVALLEDVRRTASIKALTYCDLFKLDKQSFQNILHRFPAFRKLIEGVRDARRKAATDQPSKEKEAKTVTSSQDKADYLDNSKKSGRTSEEPRRPSEKSILTQLRGPTTSVSVEPPGSSLSRGEPSREAADSEQSDERRRLSSSIGSGDHKSAALTPLFPSIQGKEHVPEMTLSATGRRGGPGLFHSPPTLIGREMHTSRMDPLRTESVAQRVAALEAKVDQRFDEVVHMLRALLGDRAGTLPAFTHSGSFRKSRGHTIGSRNESAPNFLLPRDSDAYDRERRPPRRDSPPPMTSPRRDSPMGLGPRPDSLLPVPVRSDSRSDGLS